MGHYCVYQQTTHKWPDIIILKVKNLISPVVDLYSVVTLYSFLCNYLKLLANEARGPKCVGYLLQIVRVFFLHNVYFLVLFFYLYIFVCSLFLV